MQRIPLNLAEEGMTLAKPITRDNGMVLVGEGTELTASLIARLENMDVSHVTVKGGPVDAGGGDSERAGRLDHLFRKHKGDPWMQAVKKHFHSYFTMRAASLAKASQAEEEEE